MITLLTMQELHGLTAQELGELHQLFSMLLIETEPDTPDRRNILLTPLCRIFDLGTYFRPNLPRKSLIVRAAELDFQK